MENTITKNSRTLNCNSLIKSLSIIALICTVLSCAGYFFYYPSYELAVRPSYFWDLEDILSFILGLAPVVLLVIYLFKFHSKLKATVLIPIIFSIFVLCAIDDVLYLSLHMDISTVYFTYYISFLPYGINCILPMAGLVCSILAVISALKGFNKKIFIIISMSLLLLCETLISFEIFIYDIEALIEHSLYLYILTTPLHSIGRISLYITLLLFGLKSKIPAILSVSPEKGKAKADKMNPEQALKNLKDKLDLGIITEEKYQAQRAEIISKL